MTMVLIVEDEFLEQQFLKSIILDGFLPEDKILSCESGLEAIRLAKQHKPDIIIMDLMISELDGLSTIKEIRKFLPDACIAILSAYSDFSYAQKAINLGVFEYLLKPVKPIIFRETFQKMIDEASSVDLLPSVTKQHKNTITQDDKSCFINESTDYIKNHFTEKLTLEAIASRVFMNPKYFSRVFKQELGITFTEYVVQLRIEHACRLLETTKYPAYRISSDCGFSDPSYFNRVFYAQMNMTPIAYRKNMYTP